MALCVPLTRNLKRQGAPGNVLLRTRFTGLERGSVADVSRLIAVDKALLVQRTGRLTADLLRQVLSGIDVVLGR